MPEGEEKSFPATPQRRAEARKKGQVARSAEFGAALTLLALVIALHALLPGEAGLSLISDLQAAFRFSPHDSDFTFATVQQWQVRGLGWAARILLPAGLLAFVLSLVAGIGQVGFAVTPEALAPQWTRINPASGFKRLLSMRGTVEASKGWSRWVWSAASAIPRFGMPSSPVTCFAPCGCPCPRPSARSVA